jgi:hypothetical protein
MTDEPDAQKEKKQENAIPPPAGEIKLPVEPKEPPPIGSLPEGNVTGNLAENDAPKNVKKPREIGQFVNRFEHSHSSTSPVLNS